jgi:hypothetical protein
MKQTIRYEIKDNVVKVTIKQGAAYHSADITLPEPIESIADIPLFVRLQAVNSLLTSLENGS